MNPEEFLERLSRVRIDRSHGGRAPHKPLMLLLALGRVSLGPKSRLIPYEAADDRFKELWREFGRPEGRARTEYPFGRLRNDDDLWEIPEESLLSKGRRHDIPVAEAKRFRITGGFQKEVHDLLCRDRELVSRAARQILFEHFPSSIHEDILNSVQVEPSTTEPDHDDPVPRRGMKVREYAPRDSRFRKAVLEAYEERCAVCEHDIRFGERLLGLEAAHIRWHSHDGADSVPNGLALCSVHHKALDYGALGLESKLGGFHILISSRVHGSSPSAKSLLGLACTPIRPPARPFDVPDHRFVAWHREQVFRP